MIKVAVRDIDSSKAAEVSCGAPSWLIEMREVMLKTLGVRVYPAMPAKSCSKKIYSQMGISVSSRLDTVNVAGHRA